MAYVLNSNLTDEELFNSISMLYGGVTETDDQATAFLIELCRRVRNKSFIFISEEDLEREKKQEFDEGYSDGAQDGRDNAYKETVELIHEHIRSKGAEMFKYNRPDVTDYASWIKDVNGDSNLRYVGGLALAMIEVYDEF